MDRHGFGQCLGAIEVEAGEDPSKLAASTYAASGSRICVKRLWSLILNMPDTVAIGRGPYAFTQDTWELARHVAEVQ
jgi:hypothetical protein